MSVYSSLFCAFLVVSFTQNQHKLFPMLLLLLLLQNIVGVVIKAPLLENRYLNLLPAAMLLLFLLYSTLFIHPHAFLSPPFSPYFHHKFAFSAFYIFHVPWDGRRVANGEINKCFVTFTDGTLEQIHIGIVWHYFILARSLCWQRRHERVWKNCWN